MNVIRLNSPGDTSHIPCKWYLHKARNDLLSNCIVPQKQQNMTKETSFWLEVAKKREGLQRQLELNDDSLNLDPKLFQKQLNLNKKGDKASVEDLKNHDHGNPSKNTCSTPPIDRRASSSSEDMTPSSDLEKQCLFKTTKIFKSFSNSSNESSEPVDLKCQTMREIVNGKLKTSKKPDIDTQHQKLSKLRLDSSKILNVVLDLDHTLLHSLDMHKLTRAKIKALK